MYRPILERLVRSCLLVAASAVLISSAGVTPATAAESFTPTMKDMLSIQGAIERYERGMDTRDRKLQESAFWDDAVIISPQGKRSFKQAMGGPPPAAADLRPVPADRHRAQADRLPAQAGHLRAQADRLPAQAGHPRCRRTASRRPRWHAGEAAIL